jgi:hypothetical protein
VRRVTEDSQLQVHTLSEKPQIAPKHELRLPVRVLDFGTLA